MFAVLLNLNVSKNSLIDVQGISSLKKLLTLNASENQLGFVESYQDANRNKKYDADIGTGPQISKSKNILLKALERKNKHLSEVKWAATNNVFAKVKIILDAKLWFTQKLKNIGGSDQLFFLKLYNQGCKIIWNSNSKVFEQKNIERENFTWFVKRNVRYGTSSIIIFQELYGKYSGIYFCILKFIYELLLSVLFLTIFFLSPRLNFFKSLQYFLRSLSTFLGIFGLRYKEYKKN